jgi:HNH endonuclease
MTPVEFERFNRSIDTSTDCWLWTGTVATNGYGRAWDRERKRARPAHRYSYEMFVGPVPDGKELDHLCRNRRCVRPDHLEAVVHRENVLRGVGVTSQNAVKEFCAAGHLFDEANTYRKPNGWRNCRLCTRVWSSNYWRKTVLARKPKAPPEGAAPPSTLGEGKP